MRFWKRVNKMGETTTVEGYSDNSDIDGAIEIKQDEFDAYVSALPKPIEVPVRDLAKEIDQIKTEIAALKTVG